jgi:hypothetical protein
MPLARRLFHYLGDYNPYVDGERDLTPAQRRRAWHKALRSGERHGRGRELLGCKGHATPRQRKPRRDA